MGVFSKSQGPANDVKRNGFDGSFENHATFNFGDLVPVLCKEVMSGDTFEIDSAFGLNFMPTVFPVQSKINASLHYFYVRGKNLWKDYYDWYFGTREGLTPPYIDPNSFSGKPLTGSLYDYMGLPTTLVGSVSSDSAISKFITDGGSIDYADWIDTHKVYPLVLQYSGIDSPSRLVFAQIGEQGVSTRPPSNIDQLKYFLDTGTSTTSECGTRNLSLPENFLFKDKNLNNISLSKGCVGKGNALIYPIPFNTNLLVTSENIGRNIKIHIPSAPFFTLAAHGSVFPLVYFSFGDEVSFTHGTYPITGKLGNLTVEVPISSTYFNAGDTFKGILYLVVHESWAPHELSWLNGLLGPDTLVMPLAASANSDGIPVMTVDYSDDDSGVITTVQDIGNLPDNVFSSGAVKINALPFRAYESIYNAFYRDARNNPFLIDGEPEYNKFITSDEGGIDSFPYALHSRNWENDFLTTSQPTPQFGVAPLVGITSTGTMSFTASEDGHTYNVQAEVGEDGSTINSVSYAENLPASVRRSLVDVVSSGISINDFRNVNAFQRFLETSMRRGLKAFDQIKAHFNVDVDEKILDMPEFIGGCSAVVNSSKVNNTSETDGSPLGSYAGQLSLLSSQKHKIKCFCDQPGYIIGILCVHPVPLYSQLLPKMFTKFDSLDNFFPEFGNIGMQPILMQEVAPVQAYTNGASALKDVFGYQRAWYEYLSSVDEVHGLFRTQLRNFVLNRVFDDMPKLGPDFTVINDRHLNDIFSVVVENDDNVQHKILGKVVFDIKMIRPIPKFGIPRLEPSV